MRLTSTADYERELALAAQAADEAAPQDPLPVAAWIAAPAALAAGHLTGSALTAATLLLC